MDTLTENACMFTILCSFLIANFSCNVTFHIHSLIPGDSRPQTTAGRYLSTPGQLGVSVPSAPAPTPTEKDLSLHHGGHGHQNHNGTADRTELSKEQPFRYHVDDLALIYKIDDGMLIIDISAKLLNSCIDHH